MTRRPLLVASAATAALALCAASGTAAAAAETSTAAGRGASSLSLLELSVGGHSISLADIVLTSDTIASPRVSSVSVTPVTVDGTAYGRQTVNQASSPKTIGGVAAPSAISPFASLTSPAIAVNATGTPSNTAGAGSLGSVNVLGMPVNLAGALQAASAVNTTSGASGIKTVTLEDLALPSIADVLAALGLDLSALPVGSLADLVTALELVTGAVSTAQGAVDTAQGGLDDTTADLAGRAAALSTAQGTLTTATTALTAILSPLSLTIADFAALSPVAQQALDPTNALGLLAAFEDYTDAKAAFDAAQGLVDTAQGLVTTATNALSSALSTLLDAIMGVLDGTPLVSLQSLEVATRAAASSASKGGQHAEVVGGVVKGLKVLGVDVLDAALGSSTLDLEGAVTSKLAEVNGVIAEVTGTLSEVLSSIPSLPALEIPAPVVGLLTKSTSTSISEGFGRATTTVSALSISLPAITLPTSVAVPGAAALPGLAGVTQVAGQLTSAPLAIDMLTLHDQAAFRPAVAGSTPGTGSPQTDDDLADTGLPAGVAAMALLLAASALLLRRRAFVTV